MVPSGQPHVASPQSITRASSADPGQQTLPECRSSCCTESGTGEAASSAHQVVHAGSTAARAGRPARGVSPPSSTGVAASSSSSCAGQPGHRARRHLGDPGASSSSRCPARASWASPYRAAPPPTRPQLVRRAHLAQHRPGVAAQRPAPRRVDREHLGHQARHPPVEPAPEQGRLVPGAGAVDLEPHPAGGGLEADRAGPRPGVRLVASARSARAVARELGRPPRRAPRRGTPHWPTARLGHVPPPRPDPPARESGRRDRPCSRTWSARRPTPRCPGSSFEARAARRRVKTTSLPSPSAAPASGRRARAVGQRHVVVGDAVELAGTKRTSTSDRVSPAAHSGRFDGVAPA